MNREHKSGLANRGIFEILVVLDQPTT